MGCKSRMTYENVDHDVQKFQDVLHAIHGECDKDSKDVDIEQVEGLTLNSPVVSNLTFNCKILYTFLLNED